MNTLTHIRRRAAYACLVAVFLACRTADACDGCRQAIGGDGAGGSTKVNSIGVGYALSIGMLLLMVASLVASLGWMMYRNCRAIADAQRRQVEDAGGASPEIDGGALPGAVRA